MSNAAQIKSAFIYSKRADLVTLLRTTLRTGGISEDSVHAELTAGECIEQLKTKSDAAVVLDWEAGSGEVLKILESARADHKVDVRPTLLIAKDMSNEVVAIGAEYNVTCVHIGELSNTSVRVLVKELLDSVSEVNNIRESLRRVSELRAAGNWEEATKTLEDLYGKEPNNARIAAELAESYIRADAWQSAINCLEPFSKMEPPDVRCLHLLGRSYLKLGRAGEATNLLSRAKIISPYNVERLIDLGQALLKIDQIEEAQEVFDEALELDPSSKGANQGRGTCQLLQGELNEGLALIRQVSDNRELAAVFNTAAVLTIHRNHHARAMKLYDTAILAIGTDKKLLARLYFNKGIGFYRWTRLNEAAACFQKSTELDPGFVDASFNLKILHRRLNKTGSVAIAPASGSVIVTYHKRTGTDGVSVPIPLPNSISVTAAPEVRDLAAAAANSTKSANNTPDANGKPKADLTYDEIDADFATSFGNTLEGEDESFF
jgi:tetratricopeptide (TPR) repeat protein